MKKEIKNITIVILCGFLIYFIICTIILLKENNKIIKPAEPISAKSEEWQEIKINHYQPIIISDKQFIVIDTTWYYCVDTIDSLHSEVDSLKAEVRKWRKFFVEQKKMKEDLREENARLELIKEKFDKAAKEAMRKTDKKLSGEK